MKPTLTLVLALLVAVSVSAQQPPPPSEIYLAPMPEKPGATLKAINISNSPGYDNQPSFLPDGSGVLFSSFRDGKQNDIYRYDIATKQLTQVTKTPYESEFSPTVTPDGRTFSVVRVEADKTQRLWRFSLDGSNPRVILEEVKPVGYHVWIDDSHLALYVLGTLSTLQLASTRTGTATVIDSGVDRTLAVRPKTGTVVFYPAGEPPELRELDPKTGKTTRLFSPVVGSKDCAWTPDGRLLMAKGSTVFVWRSGAANWEEVASVAAGEPGNITRLAVSPDGKWLAYVAEQR